MRIVIFKHFSHKLYSESFNSKKASRCLNQGLSISLTFLTTAEDLKFSTDCHLLPLQLDPFRSFIKVFTLNFYTLLTNSPIILIKPQSIRTFRTLKWSAITLRSAWRLCIQLPLVPHTNRKFSKLPEALDAFQRVEQYCKDFFIEKE